MLRERGRRLVSYRRVRHPSVEAKRGSGPSVGHPDLLPDQVERVLVRRRRLRLRDPVLEPARAAALAVVPGRCAVVVEHRSFAIWSDPPKAGFSSCDEVKTGSGGRTVPACSAGPDARWGQVPADARVGVVVVAVVVLVERGIVGSCTAAGASHRRDERRVAGTQSADGTPGSEGKAQHGSEADCHASGSVRWREGEEGRRTEGKPPECGGRALVAAEPAQVGDVVLVVGMRVRVRVLAASRVCRDGGDDAAGPSGCDERWRGEGQTT